MMFGEAFPSIFWRCLKSILAAIASSFCVMAFLSRRDFIFLPSFSNARSVIGDYYRRLGMY